MFEAKVIVKGFDKPVPKFAVPYKEVWLAGKFVVAVRMTPPSNWTLPMLVAISKC